MFNLFKNKFSSSITKNNKKFKKVYRFKINDETHKMYELESLIIPKDKKIYGGCIFRDPLGSTIIENRYWQYELGESDFNSYIKENNITKEDIEYAKNNKMEYIKPKYSQEDYFRGLKMMGMK
ncbi:hypothetical protein DZC34_14770 [Clostridium botulinum]|nr:hypothetical protein DZC34_14770 [Clostridium botulinum]